MTKTRWLIFIAICVIVLGGLVVLARKDKVDVSGVDASQLIASTDSIPGDHVYGKKDAKVILVEYGDFQCPYCGQAYPQVKTVTQTYQNSIAFVFRNFPITTAHPNALAAATAAEAAGLQGKYWEMNDKLYETQNSWSDSNTSDRTNIFVGYAKDLGLNVDQFRNDLSNQKVVNKINRDRGLASKLGVNGTPTFYIGNEKLSDDVSSDLMQGSTKKLSDKLDAALKAAGETPPARN